MTPADRRITELIEKWLTSVELHLQYAELSDAAYARAQRWPKHDRPTRWVLEVARQKLLELKGHCETRQAMGDGRFSESLELMAFLANLVGIQHIERFVPLADPSYTPPPSGTTATVEAPAIPKPPQIPKPPPPQQRPAEEATREMPRLKPAPAPARAATPQSAPARGDAKPAARPATSTARPAPAAKSAAGRNAPKSAPADLKGKIIADAIRLLKWGKPWHELAELIARIAERPPEADIRKVLRAHKAEIEAKAAEND
jgi:hypothetical protein